MSTTTTSCLHSSLLHRRVSRQAKRGNTVMKRSQITIHSSSKVRYVLHCCNSTWFFHNYQKKCSVVEICPVFPSFVNIPRFPLMRLCLSSYAYIFGLLRIRVKFADSEFACFVSSSRAMWFRMRCQHEKHCDTNTRATLEQSWLPGDYHSVLRWVVLPTVEKSRYQVHASIG